MWSHYNRTVAVDIASGSGRPTQSSQNRLDFNVGIAKSNLGRVDQSIGTSSIGWAWLSRLLPKTGERQSSKLFFNKTQDG
jgi:hypothetical protein